MHLGHGKPARSYLDQLLSCWVYILFGQAAGRVRLTLYGPAFKLLNLRAVYLAIRCSFSGGVFLLGAVSCVEFQRCVMKLLVAAGPVAGKPCGGIIYCFNTAFTAREGLLETNVSSRVCRKPYFPSLPSFCNTFKCQVKSDDLVLEVELAEREMVPNVDTSGPMLLPTLQTM